MSDGKHHPMGPSSLARRRGCPGSYRMESGLPGFDSPDAIEGRYLHECVANQTFPDDPEQEDMVAKCLEIVAGIETCNPGSVTLWEPELRLLDENCRLLFFGHADVLIYSGEKGDLIDWKFGRNAVECAHDNIQLAAYALAAAQKFQLRSVCVHVFQPRLNLHQDYEFREFENLLENIRDIISRSLSPDAPLVPGEWCRYCRANQHGACPFLKEEINEIVRQSPNVRIADMPDKKLSAFLDRCIAVEKLKEAAKQEMLKRCIESSDGICGDYEKKVRSGSRKITDTAICYNIRKDIITQDEFLRICAPQVGKLETLYIEKLRDVPEGGKKPTLKKCKNDFSADFAGVMENGPDVVFIAKRGDEND